MKPHENNLSHRILVIDDNTAIHQDFCKILMKSPDSDNEIQDMETALFGAETQTMASGTFEIDCVFQGREGLAQVQKAKSEGRPYSLAFVDGRMPPGWDGIETISHLWQESPDLQVVLCTAYADYSWQEIRRVLGETDSLLILKKPFDNVEVLQLAHALTRKWELNNEIQGRLNQLAFYDSLTGLPNRTLFIENLTTTLDKAHRYKHKAALLYIDLDNFKRINDTLGHSIGDDLLKATSKRLLKCLRTSDTVSRSPAGEMVARLGGDEFTVILPEVTRAEHAGVVALRIAKQLAEPLHLGNHQVIVTPSIGISLFPQDGEDIETLLKNADIAMYFSKRMGPNMFSFYEQSMNADALKRMTIENHLRQALGRGEFALHYQPQFDLVTGEVCGAEALLRWHNWELGNVPPIEFISIAEENGMIVAIGEWVMRTACRQTRTWLDQGLPLQRIAVNVSVNQFTHTDFLNMVKSILEETTLDPQYLEIEITESLLVKNVPETTNILHALKKMNIRIAIDDFGTGYSSMSRLKEIPIDCLKIDKTFVDGIAIGKRDQSIITAIIAMAEGMNLRLIAEGVETTGQVDFLRVKQCQEVQGYLFSKPLSTQQVEVFFQKAFSLEKNLENTGDDVPPFPA
ncbi:signal transduction family protein (GGDEF domain protein) [Desulforapulum autotrophicum HRM2]|uniref:Signal transduction family protein (GGDEF domain protein) n=1 Tax=Desulforapulum autotrophicum (strain ATCC 43914 / DSM 3382 / VKM B-1955 / HRM2) TaxID=177437 RepID=C0QA93_DESAH|nr:EAL domain-containing protein [Desulforapulum autotrophicum]ACN14678.1 signal transduction family protein (GGDEF domain protein) [Desulforapulum autotrophicum HRM2]